MSTPRATYRLQFRNGMDFDRAVGIVPYLARLGVSHLYASPIFTAAKGSAHGYDVTDHNQIDPALGGREGFDRLSAALKQSGLGLILDIVPNHMAASLDNEWWRSVIEWGRESPFRDHFDIDWSEKLTLPVLGRPFDEALAAGEFAIQRDAKRGTWMLAYFDQLFPLHPPTYALIGSDPKRSPIKEVHDAQPWCLMFWKEARKHLSYRRFFEVTGLAGVRVEDPKVFDDVHRLTLALVRSGQVEGLRIDHVDGLADPKGYLQRLREEIGPDIFLVIEKILAEDEELPSDWPVAGTTGYEFISNMADVLVDWEGLNKLDRHYSDCAGRSVDIDAEKFAAKRSTVYENFEAELKALTCLAAASGKNIKAQDIKFAIAELICAFPVYRTYGDKNGMPQRGRRLLDSLASEVRGTADERALDLIVRLLARGQPVDFLTRFQQLTGPVMAKAVEDTLFYRCNNLIALNEVGCDPARRDGSPDRFHEGMIERARLQPGGLLATATHDTKRGEDARARLYGLSEAPDFWADAVVRWRGTHRASIKHLDDGPAPEPETEWMLYQALAGLWPDDAATPAGLPERFLGYVEKALREAKRRTSWLDINESYEEAVKDYSRQLLSPGAFQDDFSVTLKPFVQTGNLNSLAQTLIKMTAPGIPDIYQGTEGRDLSLVDPDNRRGVDFHRLETFGTAKQEMISACLKHRNAHADLYARGTYTRLDVSGLMAKHVVAFGRHLDGDIAITIAPRLTFGLAKDSLGFIDPALWADTTLALPPLYASRELYSVFTGDRYPPGDRLLISAILDKNPVALLSRTRQV